MSRNRPGLTARHEVGQSYPYFVIDRNRSFAYRLTEQSRDVVLCESASRRPNLWQVAQRETVALQSPCGLFHHIFHIRYPTCGAPSVIVLLILVIASHIYVITHQYSLLTNEQGVQGMSCNPGLHFKTTVVIS
ncbi:hypothetical protein EVAR_50085_1 [Eumeta japonica]|uniref:Uncharacterized protein n=1 Tax=Eumeta variegata TaxID=151549 RepID=A0A4C1XRY3_EUMVA|nr:hypothetical protein EVAR_50085_1 [Eumeta japonica]